MEKANIKYFVDIFMAISFLLVSITGIFKFPGLARRVFFWVYQSVPPVTIAKIHDWSGVALAGFVLIHLILNWSWIKAMTKSILSKKR